GAVTAPATYYGANIQPLVKLGIVPYSGWNGLVAAMSTDTLATARADAEWSWVEPNAPARGRHSYAWSSANPATSMDGLVRLLASNDVRLLAVLSTPPRWAAGRGTQLATAHYGDFVTFASAFAARYGAGGIFWRQNPRLPYLPVEQFEVWNEVNTTSFWTGSPDPAEYLKVLKPLSAAIHTVDPSGQVLASLGWESFQPYVTQLYQLGVRGSIEGISFHPYAPDAPAIIGLTQQLRQTLVAAGDSMLPIYVTEIGAPIAPSGPGATFAYQGAVSDAARAATLALAGDALAHSDCGVDSYDIYALIGSGTNLEPDLEGYMGILNYTTGAPNLTGQAIIAASQRWQSAPAGGLGLCSGAVTAAGALLPLGLTLTHTSPTCVGATVTYYGDPLEGAQLVLSTADGRVDPAGTNAFGQTQMCLANGPPITSFAVDAVLSSPQSAAALTTPDVAESPIFSCPVSAAPCMPAASISPPPAPTELTPARHCKLNGSILRRGPRLTRVRLRVRCGGASQPAARVRILLERGQRSRRLIATVGVRDGRWRRLTIRSRLLRGDRLVFRVPADRSAGRRALQDTLTA
ncbi:MAG: hypothetical protein ACRDLP_17605, partial [Solirubrobacteraceae bacterium]